MILVLQNERPGTLIKYQQDILVILKYRSFAPHFEQ